MIVCHGPKVLIWAPPKTGTSSTLWFLRAHAAGAVLGSYCCAGEVIETEEDLVTAKKYPVWAKHWRPEEPCEIELIAERYDDYAMLLTVRNPYTRLLSMWNFRRYNAALNKLTSKARKYSFAEWVLNVMVEAFEKQSQQMMTPAVAWRDSMPRLDGLLQVESLHEDLQQHTGLLQPLEIYNRSRPLRKPWQEYYTPQTVEWVQRAYRRDFEEFGYDPDFENYR